MRRRRLRESAQNDTHTRQKASLISHTHPSTQVFANKADLPYALPVVEVAQLLALDRVAQGRPWYIQPSCATTGDGLVEGLDWLAAKLKESPVRRAPSA